MTPRARPDELYADRRKLILSAARHRANEDGWRAVTTRGLAGDIGYSQPVLYGHFPDGKAGIMRAVAIDGFSELSAACIAAFDGAGADQGIRSLAMAYLEFGREQPAVYEAMFQQPLDVQFASPETPTDLQDGFDLLKRAIGDDADGTVTEVFWSALHGLSLLERAGRLRPDHRAARIAELAALFGTNNPSI